MRVSFFAIAKCHSGKLIDGAHLARIAVSTYDMLLVVPLASEWPDQLTTLGIRNNT